jgi:TonB family protein
LVPRPTKRASVLLVTPDSALWGAFAAVSGAEQVRQFDTVREMLSAWPRDRPAVVALDARSVGDLAAALEAIGAHNAALVGIALVDEDRRVVAAALERQRRLFEHLLLPIDPGTAKSVLEHAAEEAAARRALQVGDPPPEAAPVDRPASPPAIATQTPVAATTEAARPAGVEPPRRHRRTTSAPAAARVAQAPASSYRNAWIAAAAVAVLLAAAAAWYLTRGTGTVSPAAKPHATVAAAVAGASPSAARPSAAATPEPVDEQVERWLDRARTAMRDRRYIDPADDNALAHYKSALGLEAGNGEARQGLERIAELLLARAAVSLTAHDNAAALRSLEAARAIAPDHPRLASLDAQVGAHAAELSAGQVQAAMQAGAFGRATTLLAQGEKAGVIGAADASALHQELTRRAAAAQIAELARLAQTRIGQGQLLEPSGDSAKGYLAALADRGGPAMADEVARLTDLYQKRMLSEARAAMTAGAWSQAEAWVGELRTTKGGGALAQPLQKELDRRAADSRSLEAARVAVPAVEPLATAVPAPTPAILAAAAPVITSPAHLARPLKVDYPRVAAVANASGWVTVEAEIEGSGHVAAVRVLDADPKGVFDNAARDAVRRASFLPATAADGSHPRTTVSMRVRFQLEDRQ